MNKKSVEWKLENEWLQEVLKEVQKQLYEKRDFKERFKKDAIETQRELWENLGSVSVNNGLEQIVEFMEFINTMKIQKRSHEFTRKLEEKYERMLLSPYFGRIDFLENGEDKFQKCYIGTSNLINDNYDFLIYDWRAPISSMFYDHEIGEAQYKCPEGTIGGRVTLKRQYKINNGEIQYMFDSNLKIDDEILQDILSKSSNSKMKAIVTTIQREQNKIIRNEEYKNLIVQGPAGSGKTSVALHRIAYLLYKHRDKITPKNIVIFSPNDVFNDYISNVLPQLGEDNMYQTTFKEYMHKALGNELKKENYGEMMEAILVNKKGLNYQKRISNIKYKSSMEFMDILKAYVSYLENNDIHYKTNKMTEFDLLDVYKRLFENLEFFLDKFSIEYDVKNISEIRRYTLENLNARILYYEDQPPLLYLKSVLGGLPKTSEIKYVIIDEAQDYTPLQYEIFHQLFKHANMTILGDLHQSINPFMNVGDYSNISEIFPKDNTCIINLTKSYRSTMEITKFSRRLLNKKTTDECVERSGEEPLVIGFKNEEAIKDKLFDDIKIYKEKGYKSIGIVTRTVRETQEVYSFLKDKISIKAIMKDDDEFVSDTLVIPAYLAKGLEFDVVLIYNAGDENYDCEEERLLLYTACTRALHVLCIYYSGKVTPLLAGSY